MDRNDFRPHSKKQEALITSDAEITIGATGTQFGKSQGGTLWMQRQIFTFTDEKDNFLVGAPTYKILQQSIIPYFLFHMRGWGDYSKSEAVFSVRRGGTVYFRTETDPDSIVGIPNVRAGWLDEAGKLRVYFWQNYLARVASKGAKSLLTTSPYALNWIWKDLIKPALAGHRPDINLIQAASWENPHHSLADPEKRAKLKATMDLRRFNMLFGGEWGRMEGLVYDCFDEVENVIEPFQLPPGTTYVAGIDWGFNPDPFVLVVRAITPDGRHYQISEFYKTGQTLSDMIQIAKQKREVFGIERFYCDKSQPGSIEEFNRNGLPAVAADNDINRGVGLHYELIKTRRYKLFKGTSPNTLDELETYHYPELLELRPDQNAKEQKPVGQNDHAMDANRYVTAMTYRSGQKLSPKVPGEEKPKDAALERSIRIRRGPNRFPQSENWG